MDDLSSTSKPAIPSQTPSGSDIKSPAAARPSYSSRLVDTKTRPSEAAASNSNTARPQQAPPPQQKAWTSNKNPITGRAQTPQTTNFNSQNKPSVNSAFREGQRVAQKKLPNSAELNGSNRKDPQSLMSFQRKDITDAVVLPGNTGRAEMKAPNGNRSSFRTDNAISNSRFGGERTLQRWDGGSAGEALEDSFERADSHKPWDQFAENERRFGLKTDYNEEIYTTPINTSHPEHRKRVAEADMKAREIEAGITLTSHHAEERIVDNVGGNARDEEDKYSGVRRQQDFPPLTSRENRYTPPARRAPTAHTTVKGAPVDPAIISSQLKGAPSQKPAAKEEPKAPAPANKPPPKSAPESKPVEPKPAETKIEAKPLETKAPERKPETKPVEVKPVPSTGLAARPAATGSRTAGTTAVPRPSPNATETVTKDVLTSFKSFALKERQYTDKLRSVKAKQDKEVKLAELKKFANTFKLNTPVPKDLVSIIAKDPQKQKEIQEKAFREAAEAAKEKAAQQATAAAKEKELPAPKEVPAKPVTEQTPAPPTTSAMDARSTSRPAAPQHSSSGGMPHRQGGRFNNQYNNHNQYGARNSTQQHMGGKHMGGPPQPAGTLGQRIREQKMQHHMGHPPVQDMRLPPTGPANGVDPSFGRRISGVPPSYMGLGPKLNPNVSDFRPGGPGTFVPPFNPVGPSQGSSPRSSVLPVPEAPPAVVPSPGQLIRRKTKSLDAGKCAILSNIRKIQPPPGRHWDDNSGLRPAYDTHPAWRPFDEEKESPDSTMHLTRTEYLNLSRTDAMATPNPTHVLPQNAHQYQLPFHLQHGSQNLAPRNSPHMSHMPMHGGQHGAPVPQVPFSAPDEHRMMHSSSAQSFASPRMGQVPMAYPVMNAPMQAPYSQQVMQPYMNPGAPPMGPYRSYSNNPQYMPQQPHHMGPMMVQPPYMPPGGMVAAQPPVGLYPGAPQQFIPTGAVPHQPMTASNGFPSPGRPAAPMMAPQGSHQGQSVYGMSPAMPYQQPAYTPQQAAQTKFSNQRPQ